MLARGVTNSDGGDAAAASAAKLRHVNNGPQTVRAAKAAPGLELCAGGQDMDGMTDFITAGKFRIGKFREELFSIFYRHFRVPLLDAIRRFCSKIRAPTA